MPIRGEGLRSDDEGNNDNNDNAGTSSAQQQQGDEDGKVVYVLHPNCAFEEI